MVQDRASEHQSDGDAKEQAEHSDSCYETAMPDLRPFGTLGVLAQTVQRGFFLRQQPLHLSVDLPAMGPQVLLELLQLRDDRAESINDGLFDQAFARIFKGCGLQV